MPKVTEAHLEARRDQIMEAAYRCFGRQGFHQTTMQDICREAELSPGAVYRYFESKDDIIIAACEACQQPDLKLFGQVAGLEDTFQILDVLADTAFADFLHDDAEIMVPLHVLWWSEAMRSEKLRTSYMDNALNPLVGALAQIVAAGQSKGDIDPELDTLSAARVLLATWQGFLIQRALDPEVEVAPYLQVVKALYKGSFLNGNEGEPPIDDQHNGNSATSNDHEEGESK